MTDLKNKTVLITGASSGIGRACAESFAQAGCRLILAARRKDRLEELASDLNCESYLLTIDIRDKNAVSDSIKNLPT